MTLRLDTKTLRRHLALEAIGERPPFDDAVSAERHARSVAEALPEQLGLEVVRRGYGASYLDLLLHEPGSAYRRGQVTVQPGLAVHLAILAPVAVYGPAEATTFERGGGATILGLDDLYRLPSGEGWPAHEQALRSTLEDAGYILPLERADAPGRRRGRASPYPAPHGLRRAVLLRVVTPYE